MDHQFIRAFSCLIELQSMLGAIVFGKRHFSVSAKDRRPRSLSQKLGAMMSAVLQNVGEVNSIEV